jgi:hypothetical protein
MTDTNTQPSKDKRPTHTVFAKTYIDGSQHNIKIGVAWKHSKGDGFNISLNDMVAFENKGKAETNPAQSPKNQPKP